MHSLFWGEEGTSAGEGRTADPPEKTSFCIGWGLRVELDLFLPFYDEVWQIGGRYLQGVSDNTANVGDILWRIFVGW